MGKPWKGLSFAIFWDKEVEGRIFQLGGYL